MEVLELLEVLGERMFVDLEKSAHVVAAMVEFIFLQRFPGQLCDNRSACLALKP